MGIENQPSEQSLETTLQSSEKSKKGKYPVAVANFTLAPEQFNSPRVEEMQRRLGAVGVYSSRTPVEGWADIELELDDVTYYGEDRIENGIDAYVRQHSSSAR